VFPKLAVLILSLALGACILLAARQMRIQAVHELAAARLRILEADARLWKLRSAIAAKVTPQQIEAMASGLGPMRPLIFEDPDARLLAERMAAARLITQPVTPRPVRREQTP
jgi:hypothetical protein